MKTPDEAALQLVIVVLALAAGSLLAIRFVDLSHGMAGEYLFAGLALVAGIVVAMGLGLMPFARTRRFGMELLVVAAAIVVGFGATWLASERLGLVRWRNKGQERLGSRPGFVIVFRGGVGETEIESFWIRNLGESAQPRGAHSLPEGALSMVRGHTRDGKAWMGLELDPKVDPATLSALEARARSSPLVEAIHKIAPAEFQRRRE